MPPAFVLSQDQTLRKIKLFYQKFWLALMIFSRYSMFEFSSEFQGSHRTIQFSISCQTLKEFDGCLIYHSFSRLSSRIINFFQTFLKLDQHCCSSGASPWKAQHFLIYHTSKCLSNRFSKFFQTFSISLITFVWALRSSISDDFLIYTAFFQNTSSNLRNFAFLSL